MSLLVDDTLTWRRIAEHLDRGLELQGEDRESWLRELAEKEPLIAIKLRDLFVRHASLTSDGFLESPALHVLDYTEPMDGKRVGAYTVERLLGRGGMGEVWLASRSDGRFEGRCALKFLNTPIARPRLAERFHDEGRLLARLIHPNIARLLDAGVGENERPYLVLDYVDGEPIDRYCESHSLSIESRVKLFLDVVSAVAHAHANLVIHRDIKPTNVLVTREGVAKLLDFGVARLVRTDSAEDGTSLTRDMAMTPEYAAPEQFLGSVPSTATDVYQLGRLLYVLLVGRHPLPTKGTPAERLKASLSARMPLASELTKGATRRALRGDLDAILAKATRKDPEERYTTAAAMRDDLARYLNREPVSARRGGALYLALRFVQRHWAPVLATSLVVVGLCIAVVIIAAERDRAAALARNNSAVTYFLGALMTEAAAVDKPMTLNDIVTRGEQLALANKGDDPEGLAAILLVIAGYRDAVDDHVKALSLVDRGLQVLGESRDEDLRIRLVCQRALISAQMEPPEASIRAIASELDHAGSGTMSRAECLFARGLIANIQHDGPNAVRYLTESIAELRASKLGTRSLEATQLSVIASAYREAGQIAAAIENFQQALKMYTDLGMELSEQALTTRNNLAVTYLTAGMPRSAFEIQDEAFRLMPKSGQTLANQARVFNRARSLDDLGRYAEAMAAYEGGVAGAIEAHNRSLHISLLLAMANASRQMGNTAAAQGYLAQLADRLGPSEPADSFFSIRAALSRGLLDLALNKVDEAEAEFARASIKERTKPTTIEIRLGQAEAALLKGNATAATEHAREALSIATPLQGGVPWSNLTGRSWLMLGRALQSAGDNAQAHKAFESAVKHLSNTVDPDHPALLRARALASGQ